MAQEKGFILPGGQYVQAIDAGEKRDDEGNVTRPEITAADYPEGTQEVPLRPGAGWRWTGAEWVDETPPPPPPDLSPAQFAYMLALTGFGDVWAAMEAAAKEAGDRATYATLQAERARTVYRLDATLAMVEALADQAAAVAPETDLSADAIRAAWLQAAAYQGAGA
jgi:hypothetical protein